MTKLPAMRTCNRAYRRPAALLAVCLGIAACSGPSMPSADTTLSSTLRSACEMIDAAAMSKLVGEVLVTESRDNLPNGSVKCIYYTAEGHHRRLGLSVSRYGSLLRNTMEIPSRGPATEENPYADLGDGARRGGGLLHIMAGPNLIDIDASHIQNLHALAKKILQLLVPQLPTKPPELPRGSGS